MTSGVDVDAACALGWAISGLVVCQRWLHAVAVPVCGGGGG
jgi:hypothetical protein